LFFASEKVRKIAVILIIIFVFLDDVVRKGKVLEMKKDAIIPEKG